MVMKVECEGGGVEESRGTERVQRAKTAGSYKDVKSLIFEKANMQLTRLKNI